MWTAEHRRAANRSGLRYPSDLTDAEWALVEPMIPPARHGGRKRSVNVREVLNGIFYVLWTGCQWKAPPRTPTGCVTACLLSPARPSTRSSSRPQRKNVRDEALRDTALLYLKTCDDSACLCTRVSFPPVSSSLASRPPRGFRPPGRAGCTKSSTTAIRRHKEFMRSSFLLPCGLYIPGRACHRFSPVRTAVPVPTERWRAVAHS